MSRTTAVTLSATPGIHVGIIMDGNGRWAASRGLPRTAGHQRRCSHGAQHRRSGGPRRHRHADALRVLVRQLEPPDARSHGAHAAASPVAAHRIEAVPRERRPPDDRRSTRPTAGLAARGDRGRRGDHGARPQSAPARRHRLLVARRSFAPRALCAASRSGCAPESLTREHFGELLAEVNHDPRPVRDVDLLIRTGGEQRLSDFMLWECAYAELYFTQAMWPQFGEEELRRSACANSSLANADLAECRRKQRADTRSGTIWVPRRSFCSGTVAPVGEDSVA